MGSHATRAALESALVSRRGAGVFECEARGLRALAQAESGLVVPRVVWAGVPCAGAPEVLVTEHLEGAPAGAGDPRALGRGLAALHRTSAARFGFDAPSYCGSTPQDNTWEDTWAAFYARRRLAPLVGALERARGLPAREQRVFEIVIARLPELLAGDETPALVHGDLWAGNVLWSARGPALVDPACAFAAREYEFGITTLFGGFAPAFWDAYDEAWPLPRGFRERNPLYQLYHLLNHQLLFGGGYGARALEVARRFA